MFSISKTNILIAIVILLALFLRVYRLESVMQFIPDQGWFYLSARDMLLTGSIPLVGPLTSHPWIHHGAHWTYTLGVLFFLFNFDPVIPAYAIAILGAITVLLFYIFTKNMFGKSIAILSSILFATSPLIVMNSRIAYHTSPIPFFVIILFYCVYKWTKGSIWVFPFITFLLGILYNHEITTFVYAICIPIIFGYGVLTRKEFCYKLLNKKIIFLSLVTFLIPMLPFIVHDINHGWRQTAGFLVWVFYRIAKTPLSLIHSDFASSGSNPSTFTEFFMYYTQLFTSNTLLATLILVISVLFVFKVLRYLTIQKQTEKIAIRLNYSEFKVQYVLLFLFLSIGSAGLFVHRVPIEADTLLISPFIILLSALSILWICRNRFLPALIFVFVIVLCNMYFLLHTNFFTQNIEHKRITHGARMDAVSKIIQLAQGNQYKLIGKGELSDFPVFLMPYEYLLWWKGSPVHKADPEHIIEVWEQGNTIHVTKIK